MKKIMLSVIVLLGFFLSLPLTAQASPLAFTTQRLAGQDRIGTALSIAQKGWSSAQTVVLAEYSDYADSIAATPFAVSLNAPILLTAGDSLDPRVVTELQTLKPQNVILLGGTGCLQPAIEQQLNRLSFKWERIGGADRYETSILLAQRLKSDSLILANGDDFPDALSAASFAGIQQIPIVLTSKTFPASVVQYYDNTHPQHLIVIGGEGVIPSAELTKNKFTVETRLGGQDRYETNALVVAYMQSVIQSNDVFLASGLNFPDAVAGAVLAAKLKAPLLLTETDDIPPSVYRLLREHMKVEPPPSATPTTKVNSGSKGGMKGQTTASGGLNLRATPSSTGTILLTIPQGTTIDLAAQQGNWYETTYQAKTGWVSAGYVTVTPTQQPSTANSTAETTSTTPSGLPEQGKITASAGLNLRDTPSSSGTLLLTIPGGTTIELTTQQGSWYETTYQSKTGWVSADYVTALPASQTGSQASSPISPQSDSNASASGTTNIDLSPNGTVYILGGPGVISQTAANILEGKASSAYPENLQNFPPLPAQLPKPTPPSTGSSGSSSSTSTPPSDPSPPVTTNYDPSKEVLVNPFQSIPAQALSGKTIVLDPGHGGPDTGAIGPNHTYEKNNTLAIALALSAILKQAGAKVILTRSTDVSPAAQYSEIADLQARVDIANKSNADLFISIHNNSFTNPDVQGTATYFSSDNPKQNESLQLANSIQSAVVDTVHTKDRGVNDAAFYVIKNTTMPAVLLEVAFISNPYEEARLQNPTFQKNVAAGVFLGVYNYFKNPLPQD